MIIGHGSHIMNTLNILILLIPKQKKKILYLVLATDYLITYQKSGKSYMLDYVIVY